MQIEQNSVVVLDYTLHEGSADGQLVESTVGKDPLGFIFGLGMMLPAFEANLEGKQAGDSTDFLLTAENAYGKRNEEAIVGLPMSTFESEGQSAKDFLKEGMVIPMRNQEGHTLQGTVMSFDDEIVKMDFNHPMADKDLHFSVTIKTVREATKEELDHGHVHGEGGVHH